MSYPNRKRPLTLRASLAVALTASIITFLAFFTNTTSAEGGGGNGYVVTVKSCTDWVCTPNGGVACPGPGWKPYGC